MQFRAKEINLHQVLIASEELPASINGTIQCMRKGQYYSEEFEGKEVGGGI